MSVHMVMKYTCIYIHNVYIYIYIYIYIMHKYTHAYYHKFALIDLPGYACKHHLCLVTHTTHTHTHTVRQAST
jgi:hypothetical protein